MLTVALLALGPSSIAVEASAATPTGGRRVPRPQGADPHPVACRRQGGDAGLARRHSRAGRPRRPQDEKLAVNFDIDNTVIATYYDGGGPIPR